MMLIASEEALEKYTGLTALGFLPQISEAELESRHLGLVQSVELENLDSQIEEISKMISSCVDINRIVELMTDVNVQEVPSIRKYDVKVAVAMDKAFSFYYKENLSLLEQACEITYFSPMKDDVLPQCDLLYLGGGYPEVFKKELSANKSMLDSIRGYSRRGGFIYAECGGFMYLTDSIDEEPMVGVFSGKSRMTDKLQNFGYVDMVLKSDCMLGSKGDLITAQEFHRSASDVKDAGVMEISGTMDDRRWEGGYISRNTYGGYPHINFLGNMKVLESILESIERS
jgi:cobyrinic acid a,c-diamide synthase